MSKSVRKNKKNDNRKYSVLILAAAFVFVIYFAITFITQEMNIPSLHAEAVGIENEVNEQVQYSKELAENMKSENETKRIEETAREKLGYLKKGEILFIDSSEK